MTTKLLAFHNDPAIKAEYLARVAAHEKADEIAKGFYWEGGRGCAVGCTIHGSSHMKYQTTLGIPVMLARLEDRLFEGMPLADAKLFPRRFLEAIPVGADLSLVGWKFLHWLVETALERHGNEAVRKGCADALAVLRDKAAGKRVTQARADKAYQSAAAAAAAAEARWSAAAEARWSAAAAAAAAAEARWSAAAEARWSAAAEAAEAAAEAARWSAAAAAAAYKQQAEKLLSLLAEAPVPEPVKEVA